jgi:tRNA U34 5-carboxymethylaminomethyl modifying GTPase MnmE/TrmE
MSKDELNNFSQRELLRQTITILEEHRQESNEWRTEVAKMIAKIEVHTDYSKEKINANTKDIDDLKKAKNRQNGAIAAFSFIGLGFLIDIVKRWW